MEKLRSRQRDTTGKCVLCSMPYTLKNTNSSQRPLKLCKKILKNCLDYLQEDESDVDFTKLDCRRKPLPFCFRCFVTTEKLTLLNDQMEDIRHQILDLVETFKSELLKAREIMSVYRSSSNNAKENDINKDLNASQLSPSREITIKEEIISVEDDLSSNNDSGEFEIENVQNDDSSECFEDLVSFNSQETIERDSPVSRKRKSSDNDSYDIEATSDRSVSEDEDHSLENTENTNTFDVDDGIAVTANTKKRKLEPKPKVRKNISTGVIYMRDDFKLKAETAHHFRYKGHETGSERIILTCKHCNEDKRGGRQGDLCNFRRHIRIKHGELVGLPPVKDMKRSGMPKSKHTKEELVLVHKQFNVSSSISSHFEYKGHVVNTPNYVLTCKYCGQDKRGRDSHNFLRHLRMQHNHELDISNAVSKKE